MELRDGSAWRIWPGDIPKALQWLPTTEIDVADISENADGGHNGRAHKADNDDLQMGAAVRAVHRVVHGNLPFPPV